MNTNDERRYPIDYSDDEINGEIAKNLDLLADATRMSIKQMRHYVQVILGQTELQSRSSEKVRKASKNLTMTALALSVAAILFSGIVAWSSSRSADEWRTDQLAILEGIDSNISLSRKSVTARASADAVTLQKWRNDQLSILRIVSSFSHIINEETKSMGHHIDKEGRFQSDKYPDLPPDKIILSFKDPAARVALRVYALYSTDRELVGDIKTRLRTIES